jgi:hypothetical protein
VFCSLRLKVGTYEFDCSGPQMFVRDQLNWFKEFLEDQFDARAGYGTTEKHEDSQDAPSQ